MAWSLSQLGRLSLHCWFVYWDVTCTLFFSFFSSYSYYSSFFYFYFLLPFRKNFRFSLFFFLPFFCFLTVIVWSHDRYPLVPSNYTPFLRFNTCENGFLSFFFLLLSVSLNKKKRKTTFSIFFVVIFKNINQNWN